MKVQLVVITYYAPEAIIGTFKNKRKLKKVVKKMGFDESQDLYTTYETRTVK